MQNGLITRTHKQRCTAKWLSGIKNIKFKIRYKNIWFNVILERGKVRIQAKPFRDISLQAKAAIPIELYHQIHYLIPGKIAVFDI